MFSAARGISPHVLHRGTHKTALLPLRLVPGHVVGLGDLPHDLGDDVEVEHVRTEDARLHMGREGGRREGLGGGDGEVEAEEAEAVGRSAASRTCTWTTLR